MIKGYFGLYRGQVKANDDRGEGFPYLGRIKISIPQIYGDVIDDELPWAWPCFSFSGIKDENDLQGGVVAIPPIGATVWVMFEEGNPMIPVYMGGWYPPATKVPVEAQTASNQYQGTMANYPNIFLVKSPYKENVFVRFNDDHSIEVVSGDDSVMLKSPTNENEDDGEVSVMTKKSNIRLEVVSAFREPEDLPVNKGKVTIWANSIELRAKKDIKIYSGEWEVVDEETGETEVKTDGDIRIQASKDMIVACQKKGSQYAVDPREGEWQMRAYKTSGYEKHGE